MIDELPRELAELFAAERGAGIEDVASRTAVRAKVAATVHAAAAAGGGGGAVGLGGLGAGKLLTIVALIGGGAATLTHVYTTHNDEPAPRAPRSASAVSRSAPTAASSATAFAPPSRSRSRSPSPSPSPSPLPSPLLLPSGPPTAIPNQNPTPTPTPSPPSPSESALLRDAWLALSAHDAAHALSLVDDDVRLHPTGALDEERDALRIAALAATSQPDAARTAANQFLAAYPRSIHRALVERALKGSP